LGSKAPTEAADVLEIDRPGDLSDLAALGLTQAEGKENIKNHGRRSGSGAACMRGCPGIADGPAGRLPNPADPSCPAITLS